MSRRAEKRFTSIAQGGASVYVSDALSVPAVCVRHSNGNSRLYTPEVAREIAQAILDAADEAEKPQYETFQPGDVVRVKVGSVLTRLNTYTLTNEGYVSHQTGQVWSSGPEHRDKHFTSEKYEKVHLG